VEAPLILVLPVQDPEVVAELVRRPEADRTRHALHALRVGVLALRGAAGQIDSQAISDAGGQMISAVREALVAHSTSVLGGLSAELGRYLDPKKGALPDRLARLVGKDGELDRLFARHLDGDDSVLARRLSEIVRREFSLDHEGSILARVVKTMDGGHETIVREFDLNREDSALSRIRREMTAEIDRIVEQNAAFQKEVAAALGRIETRREERARSPRHGVEFEAAVGELLLGDAQRHGDVHESVGTTTGAVRGQKVGDHVVTFGPDSAAAGARVVVEAKEEKRFDLRAALSEIEAARKNREAQIGVFVFSAKTAPAGLDAWARYGVDVVVVWDADDPETDVRLQAAMSVARALAVRARTTSAAETDSLGKIEAAIRAVEREVTRVEEVRKTAESIRSGAEKIVDQTRVQLAALRAQVESLDVALGALRGG
jgi:hypothetical protein